MAGPLKRLGVLAREDHPRIAEMREVLACGGRAVRWIDPADVAAVRELDLLIVLGGDGTLLRAARLAASDGIPLLGVDLGTLGFLAEVDPDHLPAALDRVEAGHYTLEERVRIEVRLLRAGVPDRVAHGMNDVVVDRGASGRMLEVSVSLGDEEVATHAADGFIVATPTGSTAYALAAGGPVLGPEVPAMVLVPICAHALTARPLVVSDAGVIRMSVRPRTPGAGLFVDGVPLVEDLGEGDVIEVRKAAVPVRLVRLGVATFYPRLRAKLQWSLRGVNGAR
ncbi:MAG: NAD(+)/NADH kinase [Candidatus Sericytochromatia bacterium]|nr:NAD(+)/NADH kinase [Candidatus Sericytochromatia bacterium]